MSISKKIAKEGIRLDSLDELLDEGLIQFIVCDEGLGIELTAAGLEAYLMEMNGNQALLSDEDPGYTRFKKKICIYLGVAAIIAALILISLFL